MTSTFEKIHEITYFNTKIQWFKSTKTGLELALVGIPGPICHLNIAVRTEVRPEEYDTPHYGMPHTLEHLIFLGSEKYPFKGYLDKVANRCFAQGTNAYTAVDQTVYTISSAGSEGFFRLLPVYMDHVLFPTITDSGFVTEVHHVNGKGEDEGVVYCEMQGVENTASSLAYHTQMEAIFKGSSYASNTGGRVKDLRSLTVEQVRNFHRKYYRPDNICVVMTGELTPEEAFESMKVVEDKLIEKGMTVGELPEFDRPFTKPIPHLADTTVSEVFFPANDEEGGCIVYMGWRLCPWQDFMKRTSMYVLWKYLNESSISPVKKTFVEIEEPYAGRSGTYVNSFRESTCSIVFSNVDSEKCDEIIPKFFELIKQILKEGIDMDRMARILRKRIISELSYMESDTNEYYSDTILEHFLYGKDASSLDHALDDLKRYKELQTKDAQFWADLMKEVLLDQPYCATKCKPSIQKGEDQAEEEESRLKKQRETLGEEKLKQLKAQSKDAEEENSRPIPEEALTMIPIPKVENVPLHTVVTVRTDNLEEECGLAVNTPTGEISKKNLHQHLFPQNTEQESKPLPAMMQFNHFQSSFVNVRCWMDSSELPDELRPYIELYLEVIFGCPIQKDDKLLSHEEVIQMLTEDSVSYSNTCGSFGGNFVAGEFAQMLNLEMKFEKEKYHKMVEWLRDVLYNTVFTKKRLKISASKLINDTSRVRRVPTTVASSVLKLINFDENKSNHNASNMVKQLAFLEDLVKRLEENSDSVIAEMNAFRNFLVNPRKLKIHVFGDIMSIQDPLNIWRTSFLPENGHFKVSPVADQHSLTRELRTELALGAGNKLGLIFGMRSTDSQYLHQTTAGLDDHLSPDRAPLLVMMELLTALEGPLWTNIRGKGLAYGYGIRCNITSGMIHFSLYRSGNVVKAYRETCKIVREFREKKRPITRQNLEAARSGVIYQLFSNEETGEDAALNSFFLTLKGVPQNTQKKLLFAVQDTTEEDAHRILDQLLCRVFEVEHSNVVIVANPKKIKSVVEGFGAKTRPLKEEDLENFLNGSSVVKRTKQRSVKKLDSAGTQEQE
mmetsp:Transcript_7633/g.28614  ORF Transcript_7633/g.28614 Transcript_7633/m.28614 type:complete len:1066 (-) Transcript_7633:1378-4575(-)